MKALYVLCVCSSVRSVDVRGVSIHTSFTSLPSTLSLAGVIARAKTEKPWKAIKVTKQCFYHGHRSRPNPVAKGEQKLMQKLKNANGHDKPTGKEKEHRIVRRNTTGNNELEKSTAAAAARIKTNRNLDKCYYGAQRNWTGWTVSGRRKKREKLREFVLLTWKKKGSNNQRFEWEGKQWRKKNANQEENAKIDVLQWQIETKTEKHYDCRLHSFFYKTRTWKDPRTAIPKLLRFKRSGKLLLNGHATVTWAHNQESQLLHTHTANVVTILWRSMHTIKNNFQKVCTK